MTGLESHRNVFFTLTILLYIAVNLIITCGVIDSFKNVLTVQCDVRVSCMIISFYFRRLPGFRLSLRLSPGLAFNVA